MKKRPLPNAERCLSLLKSAGIRPTRQRVALAAVLFDGKPRHIAAEDVYARARKQGVQVSLATVYNNLRAFSSCGLLREIPVDHKLRYFDTTAIEHHHFFDEATQTLSDAPADAMRVAMLKPPPSGRKVARIDVIVRLAKA